MSDPLARKQALLEKQAEARKLSNEQPPPETEEVAEPEIEVPAAPLRENMISNAIKFLTHESVQKTPLVRRVAFLESKGMTNEEITEALRRVGAGEKGATAVVAPMEAVSTPVVPPRVQYVPAPAPPPQRSLFKTVAASVMVTLATIGGAAWVYNSFLKPAIIAERDRNIKEIAIQEKERDSLISETSSQLTVKPEQVVVDQSIQSSMCKLVEVMKTQQNEVKDTLKMVQTVLATPDRQQPSKASLTDQINIRELTNAISELHSLIKNSPTPITPITPYGKPQESTYETTPLRSTKAMDPKASLAASTPFSPAPSKPSSFEEVMKMVQSGEPLPNVKDIDDSPLNPNTVVAPSSTEKPLKPWEKRRLEKSNQLKANAVVATPPAYLNTLKEGAKSSETKQEVPESEVEEVTTPGNVEEVQEVEINAEEIPVVVGSSKEEEL